MLIELSLIKRDSDMFSIEKPQLSNTKKDMLHFYKTATKNSVRQTTQIRNQKIRHKIAISSSLPLLSSSLLTSFSQGLFYQKL
jgi:hypothetical protein